MKTWTIVKVGIFVSFLAVFAGCEQQAKETKKETLAPQAKVEIKVVTPGAEKGKLRLNFSPGRQTEYKVVSESTKDYSFVQPSINKTKEQHTLWRMEMVFGQKIESVDKQGVATANITIQKLKYLSQNPEGKILDFNSTAENAKSDPLYALIGQSYKIKLTPEGQAMVIDAAAARQAVKGQADSSAKKIADLLLTDEEIQKRHRVLALNDAPKGSVKKGDKWSSIAASPPGMLRPKTFEKIYTLNDIEKQNGNEIAKLSMEGVTSSKNVTDSSEKEAVTNFFANMFDEKDKYTGNTGIDLTAGVIESSKELLKVEWLAVEPLKEQEQAEKKTPDQLTMGFTNLYSIEKVK